MDPRETAKGDLSSFHQLCQKDRIMMKQRAQIGCVRVIYYVLFQIYIYISKEFEIQSLLFIKSAHVYKAKFN